MLMGEQELIAGKPAIYSKTVWGAALVVLSAILDLFGMNLGVADQQATLDAVCLIIQAGGVVLAVVGRVFAKNKIDSVF